MGANGRMTSFVANDRQVFLLLWDLDNFCNQSTVELQEAPLMCPVLSLQPGQKRVCNYMSHEAGETRQEKQQHVWSILVLCSNF